MSVTEAQQPDKITDSIRWNLIQRKAQETQISRAVDLFRGRGIEPVLIKGFAARLYYPDNVIRESTDIDIAVPAGDFETARDLVVSNSDKGLAIDLHRELRHFDTLPWDDLFENSRLVELDDGSTVRVLRPEDHLRVLAVHWLTDGGSNKHRLWDIYYLVANRPADFDWERCLNSVDERRRRWLTCTIGLAHKYLDLDVSDIPVTQAELDPPRWLIKTVEREWAKEVRDLPLEMLLNDPKMLTIQVARRFRPNPIWSTVHMEGSFDARTRFFYRVGSAIKRVMPSYRRITDALKLEAK